MFTTVKLTRLALSSLLAAALVIPCVFGQSGRKTESPKSQDQDQTIRLRADEVLLNITVTDPYSHQATDLNKDEFIVAEDGQRQDISSFVISRVPINVVLMLDASGSVVSEIASLRDAAMQFVNKLGPEDKVSVVEFHTKVELIQDWTTNAEDVRHALSWRFKPGMVQTKEGRSEYGSTALYDALYSTADELLTKVEGRKAIILLTDGDDTSSKVTFEQALASIVRSSAVVYVVSKARAFITELNKTYRGKIGRVLGGANAQQADVFVARLERAELLMTDLSRRTGGQIFSPLKEEEMKDVYASVARELKNQYIVTYTSKNERRDGSLRRIGVFLTRPGYIARTRESYYAPRN
ncbi:MAG TPA: VWA domain-containing protein [Blastocatellia bacterium]|nr:VWA domain-containing protein [Blastocatellia bacterium]